MKVSKTVLLILIDHRKNSAPKVQKILTGWGCLIKTRLGLHDVAQNDCSEHGLMILEMVGSSKDQKELTRKLDLLAGVKAKLSTISL
jgi:hypothetical protein